jgi:hypothetical protein
MATNPVPVMVTLPPVSSSISVVDKETIVGGVVNPNLEVKYLHLR